MSELGAVDVSQHWPFIRRKLFLGRWVAADRAMSLLAQHQAESGGEPAELGGRRIAAELGLTAGEAGGVWRAFKELEGRLVVVRHRGRGRRPDAWSFRPEISRWWGLPWESSARGVEAAIGACGCRAGNTVAARIPGHGGRKPRVVWLTAADHLLRPGLSLVDSRGNGKGRAATVNGGAYGPVDSRGNGAGSSAPIPLIPSLHREKSEKLLRAVETANPGKGVYGKCLKRVRALAMELDERQVDELAYRVRKMEPIGVPGTVQIMCERIAPRVVEELGGVQEA